jgi:hypothetical protein
MLTVPPQPSMGAASQPLADEASMRRVLGKTTYAEINGRFGSPYRESTVIKNEKTLRMASYAYATAGGDPLATGVTPARSIDFACLDQVLVSYQFVSSFKADHTDFDENKVPTIKKGVTTRDEVVALLGPPTGMQIYPMVAGKDDTGLGWSYGQVRGSAFSLKVYQKAVVVSVDPAGVVTDVQLTASGER